MDGLLRDPARFSQLELLVTQQRYDESWQLLNEIVSESPHDREACLYRLLVLRILVLRWQLYKSLPLQFSGLGMFSDGSAFVAQDSSVSPAASRNVILLRPPLLTRWLRSMENVVVSAGQRLHAMCMTLPAGPRIGLAQRSGQCNSEQDSPRPWRRRPLPITAASALSLLAAFAVSAVLLRSGDTSTRQLLDAPAPETLAPAVVKLPMLEAEFVAANKNQPPLESLPLADSVKEKVRFAEPQKPSPATADKSPEKAKQESKPQGQEAKARANIPPPNRELVAKKNPPAAHRDGHDLAHARNVAAAGGIAKTSAHFYRARRPIAVRQAARYAAPTVEKLSEGAVVAVLDVQNSWARVTLDGRAPGFVRIEYLGPVDMP